MLPAVQVLIDQADSERALRAVHSRFYLSDVPMGIGIVGPGLIGGTLIKQLKEQVGRRCACMVKGRMALDSHPLVLLLLSMLPRKPCFFIVTTVKRGIGMFAMIKSVMCCC